MHLSSDTCRCIGLTCGKRDICARLMDCAGGSDVFDRLSFADFSPAITDGECPYFIPWENR